MSKMQSTGKNETRVEDDLTLKMCFNKQNSRVEDTVN
jgi:hypothetical protein